MRIVSVCSSVGGMDLGFHRAGHRTVALCEADPFRRQVLARHWPGVLIHHDLKRLEAHHLPPFDLLVGGTPCQDLSVAGLQAGLDGERSGLFHRFAQLRLDAWDLHGARYSCWENVAGALSSNQGRDFATVLACHVGAEVDVPRRGWGRQGGGHVVGPWGVAEWRLLDAQFFGVPQRRRRVFVVGRLGADRPLEVLADTPRRGGHPAPGGQARTQASRRARRRPQGPCVTGHVTHALTAAGHDASEDGTGRGAPIVVSALDCKRGGADDNDAQARHLVAGTLRSHARPGSNSFEVVSFAQNQRGEVVESDIAPALSLGGGKPGQGYSAARTETGVRRLTSTERERLMGWPDGMTYPHGPSLLDEPQTWPRDDRQPVDLTPDGRRDAATGDGVVAHVAEWIGHGFNEVAA